MWPQAQWTEATGTRVSLGVGWIQQHRTCLRDTGYHDVGHALCTVPGPGKCYLLILQHKTQCVSFLNSHFMHLSLCLQPAERPDLAAAVCSAEFLVMG